MTTPAPDDDGFGALGLDPRIATAVSELGYQAPTPIQATAIPPLLEGRDVIGGARTGSGKTAAFGLPMLHRLREGGKVVRAIVLAPTRELALQVSAALVGYAKHLPVRVTTLYGGAPYPPQLRALREGVDIVVGTPGRTLDHIERGTLDLSAVEMLVLDEADEMLRMGFIEDVETIASSTPDTKQVMLFSATMPSRVKRIAQQTLQDPVRLNVEDRRLSTDHIEQQWMLVPRPFKLDALMRVLRAEPGGTTLVFCRTRRTCAEVADGLAQRGVAADALHGDLTQATRERVLGRLRSGRLATVIATDVAARGIDVNHVTLVLNLDLPDDKETYVHRIGRTGRAGRYGRALSFATPGERRRIRDLGKSLKVDLEQVPAPSDADIHRLQLGALARGLGRRLEASDLGAMSTFLEELKERQEWTDAQVATAALQLLAETFHFDMDGDPDDRPPPWARPRERRPRGGDQGGGPRPDVNQTELFLPIGRRHGARPGDLVGALANECGIPGDRIGRITIVDNKSFVGLPREVADDVVNRFARLSIRGRDVPVAIARPRLHPPRDERRPHQGKKRGKFKWKRKP